MVARPQNGFDELCICTSCAYKSSTQGIGIKYCIEPAAKKSEALGRQNEQNHERFNGWQAWRTRSWINGLWDGGSFALCR